MSIMGGGPKIIAGPGMLIQKPRVHSAFLEAVVEKNPEYALPEEEPGHARAGRR
ncbi:hypothetical protein M408DRAFT_325740 [Serendipita vermifera MAFF 305830]|uniref:Uncharacterized protein n=1 Tax=Serendipita vermifera MAFF 305830 TaxID=933852 RepID=A0A0C2X8B0_SERVB|nr:hypothetical protein M408DRAFT_325740 [Serendipita vermifera MAFF 305830]